MSPIFWGHKYRYRIDVDKGDIDPPLPRITFDGFTPGFPKAACFPVFVGVIDFRYQRKKCNVSCILLSKFIYLLLVRQFFSVFTIICLLDSYYFGELDIIIVSEKLTGLLRLRIFKSGSGNNIYGKIYVTLLA